MVLTRAMEGGAGAIGLIASTTCCRGARNVVLSIRIQRQSLSQFFFLFLSFSPSFFLSFFLLILLVRLITSRIDDLCRAWSEWTWMGTQVELCIRGSETAASN